MNIISIIERKKKGLSLSKEEITYFVNSFNTGEIPDYQMSALLMAIVLKGMNKEETSNLTMAMAETGRIADMSGIAGFVADKHSTGGVGDKTSLVVLPAAAACGVKVAKLSGRGLGFTGGTIDKLEAIPGFRTNMDFGEFIENVNKIGIAIASQTSDLAPADKKIYALRDVTATIDSIPLIASSIMSKKLASSATGIVLDVKVGSGAFMKTANDAFSLAEEMVSIGKSAGRKVTALVTRMDRPLGYAVGNTLEVIEAIEALKGKGAEDFCELCIEITAAMLEVAGAGEHEACIAMADDAIKNGAGFNKFKELVQTQGGDPTYIDMPTKFTSARFKAHFPAKSSGYIYSMNTDEIGLASNVLGAGRYKKEDLIDMSAGIVFSRKTGDCVRKGESIAELHTSDMDRLETAIKILSESIEISAAETKVAKEQAKASALGCNPLIYGVIRS